MPPASVLVVKHPHLSIHLFSAVGVVLGTCVQYGDVWVVIKEKRDRERRRVLHKDVMTSNVGLREGPLGARMKSSAPSSIPEMGTV
jgi:hypothetical protein